jgi:predicted transcriptional regulator
MAENFAWQRKLVFSPEDVTVFNSTRILLLFDVLQELEIKEGCDLERLCYYDFFAANPFLVVSDEKDPLRLELEISGFDPSKLEYTSSTQRFRTKRESIKRYLALLLGKGLITVRNTDGRLLYQVTKIGTEKTREINSMYAIAYRRSASSIVNKLKNYSDQKLWDSASKWLEAKSFRVDLFEWVKADGSN